MNTDKISYFKTVLEKLNYLRRKTIFNFKTTNLLTHYFCNCGIANGIPCNFFVYTVVSICDTKKKYLEAIASLNQ